MNSRAATVFIDALFLMLLVLVLLPHRPDEASADDARAGDLVVEIYWGDCITADVDLWVQSPADKPVGYSRLRGQHFSLLRDDLGVDTRCERMELAAARELVDGEWIVNLHLYGNRSDVSPIIVDVRAWYRNSDKPQDGRKLIWTGPVSLDYSGQEVTAVRWTMARGVMVAGSIHHSQIALRSKARE